jgi:crotonobetainyl-CoA:carnitine CoA-transferase CaiB-like acyl-CoA transferase
MLDALGEWTSQPYMYARYGGTSPRRADARHASISPYGPYQAGDGAQVFIGVQHEREWAALCADVLGRPGLAQEPRFVRNSSRVENDAELLVMLEGALAHPTAEQVTVSGREVAMGAIPGVGQHTDAIRAEFAPKATDSTKDQL